MDVVLADSVALYLVRATDPASRAEGQLFWNYARGTWLLHAFNLPSLPEGRAYQLWFVTADARKISAGLLAPDAEGHAILITDVPPEARATTVAAVTTEPAGGSAQPTGPIVLVANVEPAAE
jgi:anti-sigma-K factor RskA